MAHQSSTGLRNALAEQMAASLANGRIDIYSGPPPASANDAPTGTLLLQVSVNGDGTPLAMNASASDGVVRKPAGAVWRGTVLASGTAGYYRYVTTADAGAPSLTDCRMQGRVGEFDAELIISSAKLVLGAPQDVKDFYFAVPTF